MSGVFANGAWAFVTTELIDQSGVNSLDRAAISNAAQPCESRAFPQFLAWTGVPNRSVIVVLTDVPPPPCITRSDSGFLAPEDARPCIDRGAVAIVAGRFVDANGKAVRGALDDRLVGITLDPIRSIPDRICVVAGTEKVPAIRAVLRGGYVTTLVTDQPTASLMVAPGG